MCTQLINEFNVNTIIKEVLFNHKESVNYMYSSSFLFPRSLAADWQIDVGVHSRSANELNQKAYQVSEIHVHENYSASYLLSDIALLRLSTPIEENADVTPICVTSLPIEDFYGKNCVVTGWGTTMESEYDISYIFSCCLVFGFLCCVFVLLFVC